MNKNPKIIVLIEDNQNHAELAEFYIKDLDDTIQVTHLGDGEEALNHVGSLKNGEQPIPWMVLWDIKLPKYDGHEVLEAIKSDRQLARVPVVMFTTSNASHDIERAIDAGANSYIVKPTEPGSYEEIFSLILSYWKQSPHDLVTAI